MPNLSEDFARYAKAERQLCDQAGTVLTAIVRSIEAHGGLRIDEFRVTFDWADRAGGSIMANCTIVRAHIPQHSDGDGSLPPVRTTAPLDGGLSSNQE